MGALSNVSHGLSEAFIGIVSLTGAAFVISKWRRDLEFPAEPGCYLLLYCAAAFVAANLIDLLFSTAVNVAGGVGGSDSEKFLAGLTYARMLTPGLLATLCLFGFVRDRIWWRFTFLVFAVAMLSIVGPMLASLNHLVNGAFLSPRLFQKAGSAATLAFGAALCSLFLCAVLDLATHVKRSRLHWCGVGGFFLCVSVPLVTLVF